MSRAVLNKFNRGELDSRALLRDDVTKVKNSCQRMINFMPLRLGPMQYRPGTIMVGVLDGPSYLVPFVSTTISTALLSIKTDGVKIFVDDVPVDQPTGTMTLANQSFNTDLANWTDVSGTGSFANWETGKAALRGAVSTTAKLYQTFGGVGVGVEHCIEIDVDEAPVSFKLGEAGVDSGDIYEGILEPGIHSIVFTPVGALPTITFANSKEYKAKINYVLIGGGGTLELPMPTDITDISTIRSTQSADVVFIATGNTPQFKIERRGVKSWSIVPYRVDNGPFGLVNNTEIALNTSVRKGNGNLIASDDLFTPGDEGRLYRLTSDRQVVYANVSAENFGTDSIRVVGVESVRKFNVVITGTWSATITLERSPDDISWEEVVTYSTNKDIQFSDDLDNSILYYRLRINSGDYTSGTAELMLRYESGSKDGIARALTYVSPTTMTCQVLEATGSISSTLDWYVTEWGGRTPNFPTSVELYEGRLWWGGKNKLWGSESDQYASWSDEIEGDSRPIRRTIGFGPVDSVEWIKPSSELIMGVASDEITVRSNSFGNVLTQDNINLKSGSTHGVAPIDAVKLDNSVMYVHRSTVKIMDTSYSVDEENHLSIDLMTLNPRICSAGIVRMAISRQPETRIEVVLENGEMRVHLLDAAEDVAAWSRVIIAGGTVEDVIMLPGVKEDIIYITVLRDGVRYLERFSRMEDMTSQHYDGAVLYTSPGTTLTGLGHLEGREVSIWADDQYRGVATVSGGQITVATAWTDVTVGLFYAATYISNKVSITGSSTVSRDNSIGVKKRVVNVHLAMEDYWPGAVTLGPSILELAPTPEIEFGKPVDMTAMITDYDETPFEFNGENEIDPRIVIQATGPCVILALSYDLVLAEDDE